jgi:hypothetical protein
MRVLYFLFAKGLDCFGHDWWTLRGLACWFQKLNFRWWSVTALIAHVKLGQGGQTLRSCHYHFSCGFTSKVTTSTEWLSSGPSATYLTWKHVFGELLVDYATYPIVYTYRAFSIIFKTPSQLSLNIIPSPLQRACSGGIPGSYWFGRLSNNCQFSGWGPTKQYLINCSNTIGIVKKLVLRRVSTPQ